MSHIFYGYRVTVSPKGHPNDLKLLGNFDGAGADVLKALTQFLEAAKKKDWLDHSINAAARISEVHRPTEETPDVAAAVIKTGETGVSSEMVETTEEELGTTVKFHREVKHAELMPVLILAKLPGTRDKGFLISHSPSRRGVKTKFWQQFYASFKTRYPDYRVHMDPVFPEGFYRKLIEEQPAKRVTLVRHVKPRDATDAERTWFDAEPLGTITTVIAAKRFGVLGRKADIVEALNDDAKRQGLLVFQGENYDEIRVTVTSGAKEHSINLASGHVARPGYDVTDKLKMGPDGHPTYESLRSAAVDYVDLLTGQAT